jgi:hypothetical protein
MNKTEEREMAIKALKTRTENGLLDLSRSVGGYRGVVEAMHAELVRKDARIKELEGYLEACCD